MRANIPLATRLTLLFVLFALGIISGVGWLSYASGRDSLHSATISELQATTIEKQAALDAWVKDRQAAVATLATSLSVRENLTAYAAAIPGSVEAETSHARLVAELQVYTDQHQFIALLVIEPVEGQVIAATDSTEEGKFREDQPYYINGKNGPFVQNLYFSTALRAPAMTVSAPILDTAGRLLGVLAGRLNLEDMNAIINRRSGLRYSDEVFLVNTSNLFVTQPRLAPDKAVLQRGVHTQAVNRCLEHNSGIISALDYRGIPALVAYRWLPERGLCLIVKIDEAEALAPARAFGGTITLVGGITLLVAFFLAINLARSITRPIRLLQAGALRFGMGELDGRLPVTSRDELGNLSQTFNEMADTLAKRANQVEAANKELQSFAYSVSHDLRAPLRGIDGFSQALLNKYSGQLGEEGQHYLTRVRENTQRMGQLIDDMLTLSRVSRQEMSHRPLDLMALANEIATMLVDSDPQRKVHFKVAEQVAVEGDAGLLRVALQNLLENAWKFTRPRELAEIEVGFSENGGERVYFIRDNGVGFDMQYADKLFGAFQRLHSVSEFPGTGIGLATVQRVIHRHGGRVWSEAEVDKGATFYFTLGETS